MFHLCWPIFDIFEENEVDEREKYEKNYGLWGRPCSYFVANHQKDNFYNRSLKFESVFAKWVLAGTSSHSIINRINRAKWR